MAYDLDFTINRDEVKRYLGYQPGQTEQSERVERLMDEMIAAVGRAAQPAGLARTLRLGDGSGGNLKVMGSKLVLSSPDLKDLLRHSHQATFMMATLGPGVDQLINNLLERGQYTAAAIADAVGSDGAEQAMNQLNTMLAGEAEQEGCHLTRRFSPGYGNVPLELQTDWADLLGAEQIGVTVTPSHLMIPRKSITAISGWQRGPSGRDESQLHCTHKCIQCGLLSCRFRQRPEQS